MPTDPLGTVDCDVWKMEHLPMLVDSASWARPSIVYHVSLEPLEPALHTPMLPEDPSSATVVGKYFKRKFNPPSTVASEAAYVVFDKPLPGPCACASINKAPNNLRAVDIGL